YPALRTSIEGENRARAAAMVSTRPCLASWRRGSYFPAQEYLRNESKPLSRTGRNEADGVLGRDREQPGRHRASRLKQAAQPAADSRNTEKSASATCILHRNVARAGTGTARAAPTPRPPSRAP